VNINEDIMIEGDKLKIMPEDDFNLGVFFVDANGEEFRVDRRLTQNDPKKIIARIPDSINPDEYTLRIKTRFSQGQTLLKEVRVIDYERILYVQ